MTTKDDVPEDTIFKFLQKFLNKYVANRLAVKFYKLSLCFIFTPFNYKNIALFNYPLEIPMNWDELLRTKEMNSSIFFET